MNNVSDRIKEQEEYLEEVKEAVSHWMQYTDSFEEAWDKADQYDIDTHTLTNNEKADIKYYLTGGY